MRSGDVQVQQNVLSLADLNIKRPWQSTESNTVFQAHLTLHNFNFGIRYFSRLIVWGGPGMLLQARIAFKNSLGILWEWVLFHIKNGCDDPGFLADSVESDCFSKFQKLTSIGNWINNCFSRANSLLGLKEWIQFHYISESHSLFCNEATDNVLSLTNCSFFVWVSPCMVVFGQVNSRTSHTDY